MAEIKLVTKSIDTGDMLEVLDLLRVKIESGGVAAFAAVAVHPDDECTAWVGSGTKVSRLRLTGAIAVLQFNVHNGDL